MIQHQEGRDHQIDALRAWGIVLVIAGHSGSAFSQYIYGFHMPLFFFVSGFLRYRAKDRSWGDFLKAKVKSVLVPYVVFWVISMVPYRELYNYWINGCFLPLDWNNVLGLLLGGHWLADHSMVVNSSLYAFWFLQLYFIACIPFEMIVRTHKKSIIFVAMLAIGAVTLPFQRLLPGRPIFQINVLPAALVFMILGYFFCNSLEYISPDAQQKNLALGVLLVVLGGGISAKHYGSIANIVSLLYFPGAALSIAGYYFLAGLFRNNRAVQFIGENTLYILCLHCLTLDWAWQITSPIARGVGITNSFIINAAVVLICAAICCGMVEAWHIIWRIVKGSLSKQPSGMTDAAKMV